MAHQAYSSFVVEDPGQAITRLLPQQRQCEIKYDVEAQQQYRQERERAQQQSAAILKERTEQQTLREAQRAREKEEAADELRHSIRDNGLWIDPEDEEACARFVEMAMLSDLTREEALEIVAVTWAEHKLRVLY
jgi:hypothetical protein